MNSIIIYYCTWTISMNKTVNKPYWVGFTETVYVGCMLPADWILHARFFFFGFNSLGKRNGEEHTS